VQAQESQAQRQQRQADEIAFWQACAEEAEREKASLAKHPAEVPARAAQDPSPAVEFKAPETAAKKIFVNEAATRVLVDVHLVAAGWEVDTLALRRSQGTRPEIGRKLAVAETADRGRAR
jgi:type I restriction enzyme, R subunit